MVHVSPGKMGVKFSFSSLFSDPRRVHPVDVNQFQGQAVHRLHQTAHPIRIEERHDCAYALPSPEWVPCKRSFSGCPHCTGVCCESRKANGKQAVETGRPVRDRVCMATPQNLCG